MQIGENLYVNIVFKDENETFLNVGDLMKFRIVETAGASIPYVYFKLTTRSRAIAEKFQVGNVVVVSIGNNKETADSFDVSLLPAKPMQDSSGTKWIIDVAGFIGGVTSKEYMINRESKAYKGNSLLVVNQVLQDYQVAKSNKVDHILWPDTKKKVYVITDFLTTNENQVNWYRTNKTACWFVIDTLLHCDVRPNFPLVAFDKYLHFYVRNLSTLIKEGPKYTFSSFQSPNTIQYLNNFTIDDYKNTYNLYSGYSKITEITDSSTGKAKPFLADNDPILASTSVSESEYAGNLIHMNDIQSSNVHKNYYEAYAYNTNKLMALSSMIGMLELHGPYYKNLKPLDLINILPEGTADVTQSGLYLIDSIVTEADFASQGIRTYVYVTRDNKNNVENYIVKSKLDKGFTVLQKWKNELLAAVHSIKVAYAMAMQFFDGTYMNNLLDFAIATKRNILRSFTVAGVSIDFNSKANLLNSLICTGNSLMNTLVSMVFPEGVAYALWDFIILKPSMISLLSNYASEYIPYEIRDIFMQLAEAIFDTTDTLNSIAKDNGIQVTGSSTGGTTVTETTDKTAENQQKVNNIITNFEDNTTGLDVPFPIISLDEAESLLPEKELRELIANKTIEKLTDLNYMENVDVNKFKDILLGNEIIDFNIINQINQNAGNVFAYRFWGTYKDLTSLDSYTVKQGYKDKYRTLPCTKLVSALDNKKLFFACPTREEKVKFYINSKRVDLESFGTTLGYTDVYGNSIPYTVYYTGEGYNSNSVMLEVKQGGMV